MHQLDLWTPASHAAAAPVVRGVRSAAAPVRSAPRAVAREAMVWVIAAASGSAWLAIAARKRFIVEQYSDEACGQLTKGEQGKPSISRVPLRPKVIFSGEKRPTPAEVAAMHDSAHENCFIALSVRSEVSIELG